VRRGQQYLNNLGVKSEMKELGKALKRTEIEDRSSTFLEGRAGVALKFNQQSKGWPACVERNWDEVEVTVNYDSKGVPISASVNGKEVTTKEELQDAIASGVLHPFHRNEKDWKEWAKKEPRRYYSANESNAYRTIRG
jgi:hypothetical protein